MAKSNKSGCLYLVGIVFGICVISKCTDSGSSSRWLSDSKPAREDSIISPQPIERETLQTAPAPRDRPVGDQFTSAGKVQNVLPGATPITSAPISVRRIRSRAEVLRVQKFIPPEVTLTRDVEFPAMFEGKTYGVSPVRKGAAVKVLSVVGDKLDVTYNDRRRQIVPITSTDFLDRVITEAQK
jgi:hypothetical protein